MKKRFKRITSSVIISTLICILFFGCSRLELPEDYVIKESLLEYYDSQESAQIIQNIEYTEQQLIKADKSAYITCTVIAKDAYDTFSRTDSWKIHYIYNDGWRCNSKELVNTEYILTSDLSKYECISLVHDRISEDAVINTINTDRMSKTAKATYSFQKKYEFDDAGTITASTEGEASFEWTPEAGWKFAGYDSNDLMQYSGNFSCHVQQASNDMFTLNSEQFVLDFDLNIKDNVCSIENVKYKGFYLVFGNLTISNAKFHAENDGQTAVVTFDYTRDVNNMKNDPNFRESHTDVYRTIKGTGRLVFYDDKRGDYASLSLSNFVIKDATSAYDRNNLSVTLS